MSDALASVALLCGILLIAAGIVLAFVTGFDPLFLAVAGVAIILGAVLLLKFRGETDTSGSAAGIPGGQRSFQKPENDEYAKEKRSKLNDKL